MRSVVVLLAAIVLLQVPAAVADELQARLALASVDRGRVVFGPCRTCHYPDAFMGHNTGPNLSGIFGRVVGKQRGFDGYSAYFRDAEFVWTPQLMFAWLEDPMAMFPESRMMSRGVPDPQDRADLIAYLIQATNRD
jgi:cytochrome c